MRIIRTWVNNVNKLTGSTRFPSPGAYCPPELETVRSAGLGDVSPITLSITLF